MFFSLGFCPFHLKYILTHHLNQVLALSCILSISFGIYFVLGLYFFSFIWNVFLPLAVFCLFHLKCILVFGCYCPFHLECILALGCILSLSFEMYSGLGLRRGTSSGHQRFDLTHQWKRSNAPLHSNGI